MTVWEYQVVRINIGPTSSQSQPAPPPAADPVFSDSYLKQEFPDHYKAISAESQPPQPGQTNDPALQLQAFLNSQGEDGWEAIGLQQAGPHTFIVFKRATNRETEKSNHTEHEQLRLTLELASKCLDMMNRQSRSDQEKTAERKET